MESFQTLATAGGMVGVALLVLAYFLISSERVTGRSPLFHGLNLVGAFLIVLSLLVEWNLASFVIECIWIAISAYGLVRSIVLRRKTAKETH